MEILLQNPEIELMLDDRDDCMLPADEIANAERLLGIENIKNIEYVNIGPGADWLVISATIVLLVDLYAAIPAVINNTREWQKIGQGIKRLFKQEKLVAIDEDAATAVAIAHIAQDTDVTLLAVEQREKFNLVDISGMLPVNKGLGAKPFNYYVQKFLVNNEFIYIIGITYDGNATVLKRYEYGNPYGPREI